MDSIFVPLTELPTKAAEVPLSPEFGENEAGIQEFMTPKDLQIEISCAVKHRFSDFIVNEIDLKGDVVWFNNELNNQNKW